MFTLFKKPLFNLRNNSSLGGLAQFKSSINLIKSDLFYGLSKFNFISLNKVKMKKYLNEINENKPEKVKKKLSKKQLAKKKPRVPGSTTIIHKSEKFNNDIKDNRIITKEEIMKKTIKILDSVKILKKKELEETEKSRLENIEAAKKAELDVTISDDKKTKKIRPKDIIYSSPVEALKVLKVEEEIKQKGKEQTIDFVIMLNVKEAKKGQGAVRGLVTFPGGAVKAPKLCVFTTKDMESVAIAAGADTIGDASIVKEIIENQLIPFEKCLATTDSMSILKNAARILGPKGLMPNQKGGTLVESKFLEETIREIKGGKKEYRINPDNSIRLSIGKRSFTIDNLLRNLDSVCNAIYEARPSGVKNFFVWAFLFPGQGRVYRLDVESILPIGDKYFYDDYQQNKGLEPEMNTPKNEVVEKDKEKVKKVMEEENINLDKEVIDKINTEVRIENAEEEKTINKL